MKTCSKCLISKNTDLFVKQTKSTDGFSTWCKECFSKYKRNKYNEDLDKSRNYTNDWRGARIKWFQELKSNIPCIDCDKIYEPYCMDYDHIIDKGKKIKSVTRMVMDNTSQDIILKEIEKCDLICLLCHNRRTQKRFDDKLGKERKYKLHQQRNIDIINKFKSKPCEICNIQYEHYNMQIDHISPNEKLYDVCQLKSHKLEILYNELAKCQVLCALCHRRKSIIEQQNDNYSSLRTKPIKKQKLFFDSNTNTKECGLCHDVKSSDEFRINKKTKSGLDTYCKKCFNEYRKNKRNYK